MKIYNFNALTGEFLNEEEAILDPLENNKFLLPAFATFTPVLAEKNGFARCFINGTWEYIKDLRELKQINMASLEISEIREIGDTKDGFYLITDEQIEELKSGKRASIKDSVLVIKDRQLCELKEDKKQEINSWRNVARENEGAEYANDLFDIDETSQANILAKVVIARIMPTMSFTYRSKTNKDHELSSEEIINLGLVIGAKVDEIYKKSWALKALVDNAKIKEEVESITW